MPGNRAERDAPKQRYDREPRDEAEILGVANVGGRIYVIGSGATPGGLVSSLNQVLSP